MVDFDFIIVGAGFAGSVIAERIANVLNKKVLIIEKRNHIGGNCYDYRNESGIIVHKYGPHIFHTDDKEVFDYLSSFTEWHIYQHKVLSLIDGKKVPIPFNLDTLHMLFPKMLADRIEEKLLDRYPLNSKIPICELRRENDEELEHFADYVYEKVFRNYTAKQWGLPVEEISKEVTARVPVYISRDDRYFTDRYQVVPAGGYTELFERMLDQGNIKLMLNTDFREIMNIDDQHRRIYFLSQEFSGTVVFTGMIDELFDYKYGTLPYRSLDLRFQTIDADRFQESAVVNYPNEYDFTRITEFKYIHPVKTKSTTILQEYPMAYQSGQNDPFYPILTDANLEVYSFYKRLAEQFQNIIVVGRLAEYRYYDMDDVVRRAIDVFENRIM